MSAGEAGSAPRRMLRRSPPSILPHLRRSPQHAASSSRTPTSGDAILDHDRTEDLPAYIQVQLALRDGDAHVGSPLYGVLVQRILCAGARLRCLSLLKIPSALSLLGF